MSKVYVTADFGSVGCTIKINGLQFGSRRFNVEYLLGLGSLGDHMTIKYGNASCVIVKSDGTFTATTPGVFGPEWEKTDWEKKARNWELANKEFFGNSPQRRIKAQKIWWRVYEKLMSMPVVKLYLKEYDTYLSTSRKKAEEQAKSFCEEVDKDNKELEKRLKGKQDPFDSLVTLLLSE